MRLSASPDGRAFVKNGKRHDEVTPGTRPCPTSSYRIGLKAAKVCDAIVLHAGCLGIIEAAAFVRRFSHRGLGAAMPTLDKLNSVSSSLFID
jgi:hypothetical protein